MLVAEGQSRFEAQQAAAMAQAVMLGSAAAQGSKEAQKAIQQALSATPTSSSPSSQPYTEAEIAEIAKASRSTTEQVRQAIAKGLKPPRIRTEITHA